MSTCVIVTAGFCICISVCVPSQRESERGEIRLDHLPPADWDETCLSKEVWTVGFSPFQDIVLTLKDKLSIRAIEYFALVLEQQYSITKLVLLHEDELIQKVKKTHTNKQTNKYFFYFFLNFNADCRPTEESYTGCRVVVFTLGVCYISSWSCFLSSPGGAEKRLPWLPMFVQGLFHPQRPYGPAAGWPLHLWVLILAGQTLILSSAVLLSQSHTLYWTELFHNQT